MKLVLHWAAVVPVAIVAAIFARITAWLSWEVLDLLPFTSASWDSTAIGLLRAVFCPLAFVGAGTAIAPDYHAVVAIVLAVLFAGFQLFFFFMRPSPDEWLHGVPSLIVAVITAAISVPATIEQLRSEFSSPDDE
jgi:hypothetical protein